MNSASPVDISVVIPVLNEYATILELHRQLKESLDSTGKDYELIFIDDGSTDNSFLLLERLCSGDPKTKVVQFRGNFGKSAAYTEGFREARGAIIFTIDGDLQDDPKEIPRFLEEISKGYDLISGWKVRRHDPLSKVIASRIFNFVISLMSGIKIHDFNCGFKCYRSEVCKSFKIYGELYRLIPVLAAWKGFRVGELQVQHRPRISGKSKFGTQRLARGFFDFLTVLFLTRFARRPLHFFGTVGTLVSGAGFLICLYLSTLWVKGYRPIGNRPLLLLGVLMLILGIQFLSLGLIGEMITSKFPEEEDASIVRKRI